MKKRDTFIDQEYWNECEMGAKQGSSIMGARSQLDFLHWVEFPSVERIVLPCYQLFTAYRILTPIESE